MMHSFVDFNFHVPVNALVFFIMLGVGMGSVNLRRRVRKLPAT